MPIDYLLNGDIITEDWIASVAGLIEYDSYTPTLTNVAIGTGGSAENVAQYTFIGGTETGDKGLMMLNGSILLGTSGASMGTNPMISLPSGFGHDLFTGTGNLRMPGIASIVCAGVNRMGYGQWATGGNIVFGYFAVSSNIVGPGGITSSTPGTWTAGDGIRYNLCVSAVRV